MSPKYIDDGYDSMLIETIAIKSMDVNMTSEDPVPCCSPLLTGALDETEAVELALLLKALADPVRVRLISIISASPRGELCACDLPALLGRSQPTMSHHLTQLVKAGILEREQRGKWAWFKVRPARLAAIAAALGGQSMTTSTAQ